MFKAKATFTIGFAVCGALFVFGTTTAQAADMISDSYYKEQTVPTPRAQRINRTTYRVGVQPVRDCNLLRVSYRPPYVPRTEILQFCHEPLDLRPGRT